MTRLPDNSASWINADWPVPENVHAGCTTRQGGFSKPPYESLNLGMRVGDNETSVKNNRHSLVRHLSLPCEPAWLWQVHGNCVTHIRSVDKSPVTDGVYTDRPGLVCAVLTADCLPLLLSTDDGNEVAAIHIGWRGFSQDIVSAAIDMFMAEPARLYAWIGPYISAPHYETGFDVRDACLAIDGTDESAFQPTRPGHCLTNLGILVKQQLHKLGINRIYGDTYCTYSDSSNFFSYRRDGTTGRCASLIWMDS